MNFGGRVPSSIKSQVKALNQPKTANGVIVMLKENQFSSNLFLFLFIWERGRLRVFSLCVCESKNTNFISFRSIAMSSKFSINCQQIRSES